MKTNTCLSTARFQPQSQRRGMVLLIVLVLLAAFGITAMTFLLSTGQVKDAAEQNRNLGIQTFSPEALLHNAVMQVIRGSSGGSEISTHSLLEDMYGARTAGNEVNLTYVGFAKGMMQFTGGGMDYVGRVITNIDENSPFYLRSTTILAFADGACYGMPTVDGTAPTPNTSSKYLLNDLPFQGIRDYDAPDDNNKFLALRDPSSGDIKIRSYKRDNNSTTNGDPDADNDGKSDSSWIDLGMPEFYTDDGRCFKPFFAIVVEDLDGRLNVNACGGDDIDRTSHAGYDFCGLGRSASEISLDLVATNANTLFSKRNGNAPDKRYSADVRGKWFRNISDAVGEGDAALGVSPNGTPLDIAGTYCVKVGTNGVLTYGVNSSGAGALQENANLASTDQLSTSNGNPGDLDLGAMNIAGMRGALGLGEETDSLFSLSELHALLCPYDFESPYLSHRLKDCIANTSRYEITTQSWDLPIVKQFQTGQNDPLPEIACNMPIDLLRISNFPAEENVSGTFTQRRNFAKTLYTLLTKMNCDKKKAAQWAINVVDYFDRDSVITSFEYESGKWVYGCEKPELLIAETLALHNRATEKDVEVDGQQLGGKSGGPTSDTDETIYETYRPGSTAGMRELSRATRAIVRAAIEEMDEDMQPDGVEELDQRKRPEGALFVNLYCTPSWAGYETYSATNDIYADANGAVNLTKVVGNDSVWRLVVMKAKNSKQANWTDTAKRDETGGTTFGQGVERVFNLGSSTTANGISSADVIHSGDASKAVARGKFAVVGPDQGIAIGDGVAITNAVLAGQGTTVSINGAKNGKVRMSLTEDEEYGAYNGPGSEITKPRDKPLDMEVHEDDWEDCFAKNDLHQNYRILHLQRLANPNKAYDKNTNPYITVDSALVDLNTYNAYSQDTEKDEDGEDIDTPATVAIRSRVRTNAYRTAVANTSMIWAQNSWGGVSDMSQIAAFNGLSSTTGSATAVHALFGRGWNDGSNAYPYSWTAADGFQNPVPLLLWLNRTPLSPMELLNVPKCSNTELLASLKLDDLDCTKFENGSGLSGHLPNFTSDEISRKILGYCRVPSMQIVTPMVLNKGAGEGGAVTFGADDKLPFACYSMFREPGRVNLNTVCSERVFASLMGRTVADNQTLWTNFKSVRGGDAFSISSENAFRTIAEDPEKSILRLNGERGLFQVLSTDNPIVNVKLNPYFRYYPLYRLGNLATVRSNVFAVWITMALFEKDGAGTYNNLLGLDTGDLKMYRAFYIIDRTIPVGFVRGKDYNADQTILYRRFLQ